MSNSQAFHSVAEFYDELMRPVPYRMWVSYYLLLLSMQEVKPKTMLEACCGTGIVTEMMHLEGFEVEGFDLSTSMIEVARRKAARRQFPIRYEVADARTVDMGRTYEAAFSFFDSLNNILEPQDLLQAFVSIGNHIRPGDSFIFDLNTAYAFAAKMFNQQDLSKTSRVRYRWRGEFDEQTQIIEVKMKFWVDEQTFEELHTQRAYSPEEVIPLLEQAGYERIRCFHSYTLQPPREKSDRIHFACIKS